MSSLIHCIYASVAVRSFDDADLDRLLAKSRATNHALSITGMLLHADGSFFQVLEGPPDAVDGLYARIARDPQHTKVTLILREPIARRAFADWTMGFSRIARADAAAILGENDFFAAGACFTGLDDGRAKKMLGAFAGGRWRTRLTGPRKPLSSS